MTIALKRSSFIDKPAVHPPTTTPPEGKKEGNTMPTDNRAIQVVGRHLLEIVVPPELLAQVREGLEGKEVKEGEVVRSEDRRFIVKSVYNQEDGCHVLIRASMMEQVQLLERLREIALQLEVGFRDPQS